MNRILGATSSSVPENRKVPPTMAFFLITGMQIGVGILGFERYITKVAGYDGWASILIAGLVLQILVWMCYQILQESGGDIVDVHSYVSGKYVGTLLNVLFTFYLLLLCVTVLRTYLEVIQVWMFPRMNIWVFTFVFILLVFYFVSSGLRLIVGLCLFSIILGLPLLLLNYFPIQDAHVENLFPVINHSVIDILKGSRIATLSFLGIELLLVYYPFIKKPQSSKKWAHFGVFYTTLLYLGIALVAFVYYSEEQIQHVIWSTITLWKIVELPFVERFEYVGIAIWVYVIIPNICLALWSATRMVKRTFNVKQRKALWIFSILVYFACCLIKNRDTVDLLNNYTGKIGFYIYMYIPVLFLWTKVATKVRNRK